MTTREWALSPDDIHTLTWPVPWRYTRCAKMNVFNVETFESYRITACKCVHLVKCGHFPSRAKIAVTPLDPPYPKTSCYTLKSHGVISYRTGVMGDQNLHCGNRQFGRFRLLWPWPWPDDLHIRTWPVLPGHIPDVQEWILRTSRLLTVVVWHTHTHTHAYRQTDRRTDRIDRHYKPRRFASGQ